MDELLLTTMHRYIRAATLVDAEKESGRLTIDRALCVLGECVRQSTETKTLSERTRDSFKRRNMESVFTDALKIRNSLSHTERIHNLLAKMAIQRQEGLFTRIQKDLRILVIEIDRLLGCIKSKCDQDEIDPKGMYLAIAEYRKMFDHIEISPIDVDTILIKASKAHPKFEAELERKRELHDQVRKIKGNYEANKLTATELSICDIELRARRSKGIRKLKKISVHYSEFLKGKKDIHDFVTSCKLSDPKVSAVYDAIRAQHSDWSRADILNESVQRIGGQEAEAIKQTIERHNAKLELKRFFDCDVELTEASYQTLVDSLNAETRIESALVALYKDMTMSAVVQSLPDLYGKLVNTDSNMKLPTQKNIMSELEKFLGALQLSADEQRSFKESITSTI